MHAEFRASIFENQGSFYTLIISETKSVISFFFAFLTQVTQYMIILKS